MIELKSFEQMKDAIEMARANRKNLLVRMTNEPRKFTVVNKNTNMSYHTYFFRGKTESGTGSAVARQVNLTESANI